MYKFSVLSGSSSHSHLGNQISDLAFFWFLDPTNLEKNVQPYKNVTIKSPYVVK